MDGAATSRKTSRLGYVSTHQTCVHQSLHRVMAIIHNLIFSYLVMESVIIICPANTSVPNAVIHLIIIYLARVRGRRYLF